METEIAETQIAETQIADSKIAEMEIAETTDIFDYYEIADEFIDLKKQLIATQPKVQAYYLSKQKEVETL